MISVSLALLLLVSLSVIAGSARLFTLAFLAFMAWLFPVTLALLGIGGVVYWAYNYYTR